MFFLFHLELEYLVVHSPATSAISAQPVQARPQSSASDSRQVRRPKQRVAATQSLHSQDSRSLNQDIPHLHHREKSVVAPERTSSFANSVSSRPIMSFRPSPIQTNPIGLSSKISSSRPGSEGDGLFDGSLSPFTRPPKSATLPDPSSFPDPYPYGLPHHPHSAATPTLSSAGSSSASTRSSAYTNPGSMISSIGGTSGDYGNVRVASGDGIEAGGIGVGITADTVVELLSRASNGSSLSSGSRKSHVSPLDRVRRSDYLKSSRSPALAADEHPSQHVEEIRVERTLRSKPSYDTSWQQSHDEHEHDHEHDHEDSGVTSEEDYEFEEARAYFDDDENLEKEEDRTAAIVIAEEGRGLIIRGDGVPVTQLDVQSGLLLPTLQIDIADM